MITREIFQAHLDCKFKAFLKMSADTVDTIRSEPVQYSQFNFQLETQYRQQLMKVMVPKYDSARAPDLAKTASMMTEGELIIVAASLANQYAETNVDLLEKAKGKSSLGAYHYQPILTTKSSTVSDNDKLMLGFQSILLADVQGRSPQFGKVIYGPSNKTSKVRLPKLVIRARAIIEALIVDATEPRLILNSHCNECEFQHSCRKKALEKDDLSLIQSLSGKEILRLNGKGLFTVTQLSHTFRPRRKRKGSLILKDNPALRALAIREHKTYIVDLPIVPISNTVLYVDVEGVPDDNFVYLIGVLIVTPEDRRFYQLWAEGHSDQQTIWNRFVSLIEQFDFPIVFHHGKYDATFFRKMQMAYGGLPPDFLKTNVINTVTLLFGRVFFPTYSDSLKEIANFLGFKWSNEGVSGLQSIVWRREWEASSQEEIKDKILKYNQDDCEALRLLVRGLSSLDDPNKSADVVNCCDLKVRNQFRWGRNEFAFPELQFVNNCAYFDYQQRKIYWLTDDNMKKRRARKERVRARRPKVNKVVVSKRPKRCPFCRRRSVVIHTKAFRTIIDLKFSESGVKRWVVQYRNFRYICQKCWKTFHSADHPSSKEKYGHNLLAWVVYQCIGLRLSQDRVLNGVREIFGISLGNEAGIAGFKEKAACLYDNAYREILMRLRAGSLVHVDETKVSIKGAIGYVWVFTNMEEVAYVYSPSREGTILAEIIPSFNGIVVSDYYPAYDGLECKQQRCLVHLIRDLNDDLFKNQFDAEFKRFVQGFGELLKPIMQTIDKYGLKRHFLARHKKAVARFFKHNVIADGKSELTLKYQKRFIRNQDRLFTFLDYDGVPWNNNNAENAIKGFATLRRVIGGSSTEKGLRESLALLSICQTLRNKGHNVLQFLRSQDKSIYEFLKRFERESNARISHLTAPGK
jgi:predicted RecB family nuclease